MGTPRIFPLAAAGLSAIVLAVSAPTALALDEWAPGSLPGGPAITSFGFSVWPTDAVPGGAVELMVTACPGDEARVDSAVFESVVLGPPGETQRASATVDPKAAAGADYEVVFTCGRETGRGMLTIASREEEGDPSATPAGATWPSRPADAPSQERGQEGVSTGGLVTGAVLAVGAVVGGVLLHRRHRPEEESS